MSGLSEGGGERTDRMREGVVCRDSFSSKTLIPANIWKKWIRTGMRDNREVGLPINNKIVIIVRVNITSILISSSCNTF